MFNTTTQIKNRFYWIQLQKLIFMTITFMPHVLTGRFRRHLKPIRRSYSMLWSERGRRQFSEFARKTMKLSRGRPIHLVLLLYALLITFLWNSKIMIMIAKGAVVITRLAPLRFPFASPLRVYRIYTQRYNSSHSRLSTHVLGHGVVQSLYLLSSWLWVLLFCWCK